MTYFFLELLSSIYCFEFIYCLEFKYKLQRRPVVKDIQIGINFQLSLMILMLKNPVFFFQAELKLVINNF